MTIVKYVNIAQKAYQQACKYESISEEQRTELFHFIHDWFRQIEDENQAIENQEELPSEMFKNMMKKLG